MYVDCRRCFVLVDTYRQGHPGYDLYLLSKHIYSKDRSTYIKVNFIITNNITFQPKYRLAQPENYVFSLSKGIFSGSKHPKNILLYFGKGSTEHHRRFNGLSASNCVGTTNSLQKLRLQGCEFVEANHRIVHPDNYLILFYIKLYLKIKYPLKKVFNFDNTFSAAGDTIGLLPGCNNNVSVVKASVEQRLLYKSCCCPTYGRDPFRMYCFGRYTGQVTRDVIYFLCTNMYILRIQVPT